MPRLYVSVCLLVDLPAHRWVLAMDGRVQTGILSTTLRHVPRIRGAGLLYVGQMQNSYGGGFDAGRGLRGSVVDLRLYKQTLTTAAMVQFTTCKLTETEVDPVIDFTNIYEEFEAGDVDIEEVTVDESSCSGFRPFDVILTPAGEFQEAVAQCHSLGGRVKVPISESDDRSLVDLVSKYESTRNAFHGSSRSVWMGVTKDNATHTWRHYVSGSPLVYSNFPPTAGLTGHRNKQCVSFEAEPGAKNGLWTPTSCRSRRCVACSFQVLVIRVRGLCRRSLLDSRFLITQDSGNLSITGVYSSEIIKRPPDHSKTDDFGSWEMKRVDMEDVSATLIRKSPSHSFIGLNSWKVTNDVCGISRVKLRLTVCRQGQFSCKDGTCVELRRRCDLEMNCPDASDEDSCSRLILPPRYDRRAPPPHEDGEPPLSLALKVTILHIRNIDLANFRLTIEMLTSLGWKDARVLFKNLRSEEQMNELDEDELWKPHVYLNGEALTPCVVAISYSSLRAIRSAPPLPDDAERLDEGQFRIYNYVLLYITLTELAPLSPSDEVFSGTENPLFLLQKMTVTATCLFDLYAFPFDRQRCRVVRCLPVASNCLAGCQTHCLQLITTVLVSGATSSFMFLKSTQSKIDLLGQRYLCQYYLTSVTMAHKMVHAVLTATYSLQYNHSTQQLEVTLDNLATYFITSTYVPTLIIVTIGYLTLYFPLEDFSDRIMVALTTLLVEAAFFTQTSLAIPQTSYVKLVDVWFVFCIILLFFIIVTIILLNWLHNKVIKVHLVIKVLAGNAGHNNTGDNHNIS
ncbi:uncharacterized protein [Panulirus ornatus]|uniref:uncharacterized protein n=1 Tax=Panulirus ornatus TaxID=150431 RepID=UPI003A84C282